MLEKRKAMYQERKLFIKEKILVKMKRRKGEEKVPYPKSFLYMCSFKSIGHSDQSQK